MRLVPFLCLVAVAACSDGPASVPPAEAPLDPALLAPLALAVDDVRTRLTPSVAAQDPVVGSAIDDAAARLQAAVSAGLPTALDHANQAWLSVLDGSRLDEDARAELDAMRLVGDAVADALHRAAPAR